MEAFAPQNCGLDSPEFLLEPVIVSAGAVVIAWLPVVQEEVIAVVPGRRQDRAHQSRSLLGGHPHNLRVRYKRSVHTI